MDHIKNMQAAERVAGMSICPERKVGAMLVLADGCPLMSSNQPAWDDTNGHHAEAVLLKTAELMQKDLTGATLYTTCRPCVRCTNMLLGLGLKAVYYRDAQPEMNHLMFLEQEGVALDGRWILGQTQDSWSDRNRKHYTLTADQSAELTKHGQCYLDIKNGELRPFERDEVVA